jgi:phage tail sheath protein FI
MAEKVVSPGVFSNERDLSFLPQGIAQIGAAFVGPTIKGPAFIPTIVESYEEFVKHFGDTTEESYVPYAVKEYLRNSGRATIVRTLFEDGYTMTAPVGIVVSGSYGKKLVATLHPTRDIDSDVYFDNTNPTACFEKTTITNSGTTSGSFVINISGSANTAGSVYSSSIVSTNGTYITRAFPLGPKTTTEPAYLYNVFETTISASLAADANTRVEIVTGSAKAWDFSDDATYASTPWITSQKVNGNTTKNLFKFHRMSDGVPSNYEVKVGITDVKAAGTIPGSTYGSFTVIIRAVDQTGIQGSPFNTDDSDQRPNVLEVFDNVNLDPNSSNYIARRIGDRYATIAASGKLIYSGNYKNISVYVRVEVDPDVENIVNSPNLVPFGFRALYSPVPSGFVGSVTIPSATYATSQTIGGSYSKRKYFGFEYDFSTTDNLNYLNPLPASGLTTGSNTDFYLGDYNQSAAAVFPSAIPYSGSIDLTSNTSTDTRKFMVPFQGGFDGTRPNLKKLNGSDITTANLQGFNFTSTTATGYVAFKKAIDAVKNPDEFDINMLVLPGTNYSDHTNIINYALDVALDRADTFVVFDSDGLPSTGVTPDSALNDVVNGNVTTVDNNYSATYWPWVKILDTNINKPVWVPTAVVLPGVIAYSDRVAAEWYAPAGLNRGGLPNVIEAWSRLTQDERDALYTARINPIATFPGQGVSVWGQKTLQSKPSALDRINVRRLLIAIKKYIATSTKYLVFDNNTAANRNRFLNIVNPYLSSIQQRQGLYAFNVVMDETNNTPDDIDRNIMRGAIYLQPAKSAEFIILDFNILRTGASFTA